MNMKRLKHFLDIAYPKIKIHYPLADLPSSRAIPLRPPIRPTYTPSLILSIPDQARGKNKQIKAMQFKRIER